MAGYEWYVFFLCLIVFTVFTVLFTYMIYSIMQMQLKLMQHGHSDEEITKEYEKEKNTHPAVTWTVRILSGLICLAFGVAFAFSLWLNATEDRPANGIPSIKVVKSESMATKHSENGYLVEHGLDNQLQMFDIVVCHHMPAEEDLQLYDIVVYENAGNYIVHRIIGIEEPNEKHPDERHFLLKGDGNKYADEFPVLYSQMRGIYRGIRIPFAGSFVLFMQSPAGWLVIILVVFAMVATPLVENKMRKVRDHRLIEIGVIIPEPEEPVVEASAQESQNPESEELPRTDEESEAASEEGVTV